MRRFLRIALLSCMTLYSVGAHAAEPSFSRFFSLAGDYPLGARVNRTDYQSIDADARRLYIAKMGAGQLLVFDIDRNKLFATLDGFPKVTGVLVVPELHKVYASVPGSGVMSSFAVGLGMAGISKGAGEVDVRDIETLKPVARVQGGVFPDGLAYDPAHRRVFVSDELGGAVKVIDATSDHVAAHIDIGGEAGNVRYDALTGKVFVPIQSRNELVAIDPGKAPVAARFPLPDCDHPHGLIVAPKDAVGYVACDENDRLLTVDLASGRVLRTLPVAHDPDVLAIDPELARLYVASESGRLSIYDIAAPRSPDALGTVFVAEGAHTVAVDPASHRLFFALADLNGHAALRVLVPKGP
jgi:DNA-binding beta-propeller fold protein YncE